MHDWAWNVKIYVWVPHNWFGHFTVNELFSERSERQLNRQWVLDLTLSALDRTYSWVAVSKITTEWTEDVVNINGYFPNKSSFELFHKNWSKHNFFCSVGYHFINGTSFKFWHANLNSSLLTACTRHLIYFLCYKQCTILDSLCICQLSDQNYERQHQSPQKHKKNGEI